MSDIEVLTAGRVRALRINRPAKRNSLTGAMYEALAAAIQQAQDDAAIKVLVIKGHDTAFCAGNDIGDFKAHSEARDGPPRPASGLLRNLSAFTKPVIAGVCGPAVGVGTTMLLHCDIVYAGSNAQFSAPFVNLGLVTEAASSLLLPMHVGLHRAAEATLFGEKFSAERALEWGFVNEVLPPEEVEAAVDAAAQALARRPTRSLMEIRRLLRQSTATQVQERITEEGDLLGRMLKEPAAREAIRAFQEKRKPDFSAF